jgi:6-pyruvoyltetrahydropterin/6-carboxytetrahydropterin synthase
MKKYKSSKLIDGFSTCYRNHKSNDSTFKLHGTDLKFRMYFEGELDYRNWVADFGFFKRTKFKIDGFNPKEYFSWLFDHTCLIEKTDPYLEFFQKMDNENVIQLRILSDTSKTGIENHIMEKVKELIDNETQNRVKLIKVEVIL